VWCCFLISYSCLDRGQNGWFVVVRTIDAHALGTSSSRGGSSTARLAVHVHKTTQVVFGLLNHFNFTNEDISQWINVRAVLLNVLGNRIRNQFVDDLLKIAAGDLLGDDLDHLLANSLHLLVLSIGSHATRVMLTLGESNGEQAEHVAIGGLDIDVGLNGSALLLDHGAELVGGEVHAVEVGEAVLALHLLDDELELAERVVVLIEVAQADLEDAALETVGGDLGASGARDRRLADLTRLELSRGLDVVPVLARERVDNLLLATLFCQTS